MIRYNSLLERSVFNQNRSHFIPFQQYAHGNQLILDGTFGVCSSHLLLFIAMGIDEHRKGFHWPFSYFWHLQETKQHMQAIIVRSSMSFSTHGNHIFPMAKPHSFIPLLQSPTLTPKSGGPFKMSGQLFGCCSVGFIFDNVGPIVARNWSQGRTPISGSSMYAEGHLS